MRILCSLLLTVASLLPGAATAATTAPLASHAEFGGWSLSFAPEAAPAVPDAGRVVRRALVLPAAADLQAAPAQEAAPPPPFEYSDGYSTRRRIHMVASYAMLPLVTTQLVLGQRLYDGTAGAGERDAHSAVAAGIGALFVVNSVTGVWNLWEARKDPIGRGRRLTHGLLMLAADAGFVATGVLAPQDGRSGNRSAHRAVALTSIGTATASYLFMLFTR